MTKTELAASLADKLEITKSLASSAVDEIFELITKSMNKGDEVRITGFGTFSVTDRPARMGRNPHSGEQIKIKASRAPKFKAGKGLKEAVNTKGKK